MSIVPEALGSQQRADSFRPNAAENAPDFRRSPSLQPAKSRSAALSARLSNRTTCDGVVRGATMM